MPFSANAVVVLIASPGDTASERAAVYEALGKWNVSRGEHEGVVVVPWLYEQHAVPMLGGGPQSVINHQAVERADVVVAFFDARLGTETPEAVSGTAEEITRARDAGKPVHVYFSAEDVTRDHLDPAQLAALDSFRGELSQGGLLGQYSSPSDLAQQVFQAIEYDVAIMTWATRAAPSPGRGVRWRLAHTSGDTYLVENISDGTALDAQVSGYNDLIMVRQDEPQTVAPGEAFSFMAASFMGTQDDRVRVTWREEGVEDEKTWKYPLPAR